MNLRRFFAEDLSSDRIELGDEESHHLQHVLRMKAGERVELFDGRGGIAEAIVSELSRRRATAEITRRHAPQRQPRDRLTVAVSPPKGDRFRWLVEKLTEIGASRLSPMQTERGVVSPRETKIAKLRQTMIASARQSRRAFLMDITEPIAFSDVLGESGDHRDLWIAHPGCGNSSRPEDARACDRPATLLIGPEGGFTDEEVSAALDAGATTLSWPDTILRIETAAIVFSSMLLQPGGQLPG